MNAIFSNAPATTKTPQATSELGTLGYCPGDAGLSLEVRFASWPFNNCQNPYFYHS